MFYQKSRILNDRNRFLTEIEATTKQSPTQQYRIKCIFAVHGHTAAELIVARAEHIKEDMG